MLIKSFICSLVVSLFLSLSVHADAFDDALAAYKKGDYKIAIELWKPLAEQGNASAQFNLGVMYSKGDGVPEDGKQAVKWYRLAAEQGNASAQFNLGVMYEHGDGVPEDGKQAVKWYRLAAEQGDAKAQNSLANMYANGDGVPEDDKQAVKWYRLAADQGHAKALCNLAFMYDSGEGVMISSTEAARLHEQAAKQGMTRCMYRLAHMYRLGIGVEEDKIYAYMWFNLAIEAGHRHWGVSSAWKDRASLSEKMTTKELRIAQELSQKCLDSDYKKCESALPNFLHRKFNLSSED